MPVRPLLDRDYRCASAVMQELADPELDASGLRELVVDLLPIFDAQDAVIALHDVTDDNPSVRMRFLEFDPAPITRHIEESPAGHAPMRIVRRAGRRVTRFADLAPTVREEIRRTEFMKLFTRESGLGWTLAGHLGRRPGESIGRVTLFRASDHVEFDDDRALLYQVLHPALTEAARRILMRNVAERKDTQTALLNGAGHVLWMTDGFRFHWNAINPRPVPREGFRPSRLLGLDATPLERAIAFHVILLDADGAARDLPDELTVPAGGPARRVTARFDQLPGQSLGCRGRVLRVALRAGAGGPD